MLRCIPTKNKHQIDMYSKEIGLCAKKYLTILGSSFNIQHNLGRGGGWINVTFLWLNVCRLNFQPCNYKEHKVAKVK